MSAIKTNHSASARTPRKSVSIPLPCLVVGMLAFGLRTALPDQIAIDHFDEGVYSSNLWFGEAERSRYPFRALYAPPLLPSLIEWSITLCGRGGWVPPLPNVLAGAVTAMMMFVICRRCAGPAAGWAGGLLVATNDFHLLFSRTALTDVLFGFWMLLAIWLLAEAFRLKDAVHTFAAGMATSLAWWTKYNGWLILAMGASAVLVWGGVRYLASRLRTARSARREVIPEPVAPTGKKAKGSRPKKGANDPMVAPVSRGVFGYLLQVGAITLLAGLFWMPVWIGLEADGGYAAVSRNHQGYFVGWEGWLDSLDVQFRATRIVDGWSTSAGLLLAMSCGMAATLLAEFAAQGKSWSQKVVVRAVLWSLVGLAAVAGLAYGAIALTGSAIVLALMGGAGCLMYALFPPTEGSELAPGNPKLEKERIESPALFVERTRPYHWLPAAWFFSLLLATPLYAPYPRLQVPWWIVACLGAAILIGRMMSELVRWSVSLATRQVEDPSPGTTGTESEPHPAAPRRVWWRVPSQFASTLTLAGLLLAALAIGAVLPEQSEWDRAMMASGPASPVPGWENRTSTERIARDIATRLGGPAMLSQGGSGPAKLRMTVSGGAGDRRPIVLVYGDPALFYHLSASGVAAVPAGNLGGVLKTAKSYPGPVFLAAGPQAFRTPEFVKDLADNKEEFLRTMSFFWRPSLVVRLDSLREIGDEAAPPLDQIAVYRVKK